jgi:hypothetical protein
MRTWAALGRTLCLIVGEQPPAISNKSNSWNLARLLDEAGAKTGGVLK